jgi:hypothetical protein
MAAGLGFKTFTTGEVLTAADTNGYLMQGILVFASATARNAAITSPQEGQACYLKDTNEVLTYSGSAWVVVGGASGGMTLIAETVASANSSISFSSIAQTYKQLLLIWQGIQHSTSGSEFTIRLNNDSTSIYSLNEFGIENQTATSQTLNNQNDIGDNGNDRVAFGVGNTGGTYDLAVKGQLLIDNYASTSKFKYFDTWWANAVSNTATHRDFNFKGTYRSTSAITSIDIVRLNGTATISNLADTSIRLYGIS